MLKYSGDGTDPMITFSILTEPTAFRNSVLKYVSITAEKHFKYNFTIVTYV